MLFWLEHFIIPEEMKLKQGATNRKVDVQYLS